VSSGWRRKLPNKEHYSTSTFETQDDETRGNYHYRVSGNFTQRMINRNALSKKDATNIMGKTSDCVKSLCGLHGSFIDNLKV